MPRKEVPLSAQQQQDLISEGLDNFELPKDLVTKIAKSAVPDNTKLQKEVLLSLVKGSTAFVNYLAATAHDVAQSKQHKSIAASDVLRALELCELGDLVEPLSAELQVYRGQGKAGSASVSASAQQGQSSTSIINFKTTTSSSSKSKAKEREKPLSLGNGNGAGSATSVDANATIKAETLPAPFTSAPLVHPVEGQGHLPSTEAVKNDATADSLAEAIKPVADADEDVMSGVEEQKDVEVHDQSG